MCSIYQPLPHAGSIRLLALQPGVGSDPVTFSLIVVDDYKSAREYYALSYCWGEYHGNINGQRPVTTFCDGKPFQITTSLHAALCRLRLKTLPLTCWEDAVCIDQSNISERNQQLSIMPEIYRHASRVFIWTGDGAFRAWPQTGPKSAKMAIDMVRKIAYTCCAELYGPNLSPAAWLERLHQDPYRMEAALKTGLLEIKHQSEPDWIPIWKLFDAEWFYRVWVIQEVQRNRHIILLRGKEEVEWDFVALAANWISQAYRYDPNRMIGYAGHPMFHNTGGFENAFFMWDRSLSTRRESPFPALLNLVRNFRATDLRRAVSGQDHGTGPSVNRPMAAIRFGSRWLPKSRISINVIVARDLAITKRTLTRPHYGRPL